MKTIILILLLFVVSSVFLYLDYINLTAYLIISFLMLVLIWLKLKFFSTREEEILINKKLGKIFTGCRNGNYNNYIFTQYVKILELLNNEEDKELENILSEDLYKQYIERRELYKKVHHKNIMKNFELINVTVNEIDNNSVNLNMVFKCYDYTLNRKNNLIRGSQKEKVEYEYELTYIRKLNGVVVLIDEKLISQS